MILVLLLPAAALSVVAVECIKFNLGLSPPINIGRESLGFKLVF